ncbi:MAG: lytic transglycosylase domain-containing protein [Advenella sp.]|nr:lytic transglycosylase domain-containing protein [Advenella sp.]
MLAEFTLLAASCAPNVHINTLSALVKHESAANVYAIGINKGKRLTTQPTTLADATNIANELIKSGTDFDAGLGQINVRNWHWLGLNTKTVFDPCANLKAAQTVLSDCYSRALKQHQSQQKALQAALSCYNTGNFERGFKNGYVNKVLAQAGVKIPALKANTAPPKKSPVQVTKTAKESKSKSTNDGFSIKRTTDGFRLADH